MVGPVHVVEYRQIRTGHHIVGRGVVAVSAHDDAGVAGRAGLGHHIGADDVVVVWGVDKVHTGGDHGSKLVGIVLHVEGCGRLGSGNLNAILPAGLGEGVEQALGVHIGRAVDDADLFKARLLGVGRGDRALEAVGVASTEDVVVLGSQRVSRAGRAEDADLFLVGGVRYGGGAARGGRADDQRHALGDERVEGVEALGGVALVIGDDELDLTPENTAGGVDLLCRKLDTGDNTGAVGSKSAGVGRDNADDDGIVRGQSRAAHRRQAQDQTQCEKRCKQFLCRFHGCSSFDSHKLLLSYGNCIITINQ